MEVAKPEEQAPFKDVTQEQNQGKYLDSLHLEQDIRVEVRKIIEQLDLVERAYFGKDRIKQIKQKVNDAIQLLDQKPVDLVQVKKEKADLLFLRGKILDFLPEYSKMSEEFLSKAIKLMPTKAEAWEALGHVYWKKRDLD